MKINYIIGDATQPVGEGPKIIVHVCNDIGGWGRGFVTAISKRWAEPEQRYRAWHHGEETTPFALGEVQFVSVADELWVANFGDHTALVFDLAAGGNVAPKRIIRNAPAGSPSVGFGNPMTIAYDPKRDEILVPN